MHEHEIIDLHAWADAARSCFNEVCQGTLGRAAIESGEAPAHEHLCGSLIALVGDHNAAYVGLSATRAGCRSIAGAMLGMDDNEAAELGDDDVRDSIGELVNVMVGAIKTRLGALDGSLNLGLPVFFDGAFEADRRARVQQHAFAIGDAACVLIVLSPTAENRRAA